MRTGHKQILARSCLVLAGQNKLLAAKQILARTSQKTVKTRQQEPGFSHSINRFLQKELFEKYLPIFLK